MHVDFNIVISKTRSENKDDRAWVIFRETSFPSST